MFGFVVKRVKAEPKNPYKAEPKNPAKAEPEVLMRCTRNRCFFIVMVCDILHLKCVQALAEMHQKDVIQRNNIRDAELLERILTYIMDNIGQIFSAKKITDYLKNQGRKVGVETVYSYINALEEAMVLLTARRYDIKGKKVLERNEKYFLADLGIRYAMLGYSSNDISQMLENVIYMELLRRGFKVYVGKEGEREVDFVAVKGNEKFYLQVTYLLASEEVLEREYKPLTQIDDNYRKMVISLDKISRGSVGGIEWMNLIDFLTKVS